MNDLFDMLSLSLVLLFWGALLCVAAALGTLTAIWSGLWPLGVIVAFVVMWAESAIAYGTGFVRDYPRRPPPPPRDRRQDWDDPYADHLS